MTICLEPMPKNKRFAFGAVFVLVCLLLSACNKPTETNATPISQNNNQNISIAPYKGEDVLFLIPIDDMEKRISSENLGDFLNLADNNIKTKIQSMPNNGGAFGFYVIGCLPDGKLKSWVITYDTETMTHYSGEITNIINMMKPPNDLKGPILLGRYFTIYGGGKKFDIQNFPPAPQDWQDALKKNGNEISDELIEEIVNGKQ